MKWISITQLLISNMIIAFHRIVVRLRITGFSYATMVVEEATGPLLIALRSKDELKLEKMSFSSCCSVGSGAEKTTKVQMDLIFILVYHISSGQYTKEAFYFLSGRKNFAWGLIKPE